MQLIILLPFQVFIFTKSNCCSDFITKDEWPQFIQTQLMDYYSWGNAYTYQKSQRKPTNSFRV